MKHKWKLKGVFEEMTDTLHSFIRKQVGRQKSPSLDIMIDYLQNIE